MRNERENRRCESHHLLTQTRGRFWTSILDKLWPLVECDTESEADILLWLFTSCLINLLLVPSSFSAEKGARLVLLKKQARKNPLNLEN